LKAETNIGDLEIGKYYLSYFPSMKRVCYGIIIEGEDEYGDDEFQIAIKEDYGISRDTEDGTMEIVDRDGTTWSIYSDDIFWELTDDEYLKHIVPEII
jgi:hypothetical protein